MKKNNKYRVPRVAGTILTNNSLTLFDATKQIVTLFQSLTFIVLFIMMNQGEVCNNTNFGHENNIMKH